MLLKEINKVLKFFFLLLMFVSILYFFFNEIRIFVNIYEKTGLTLNKTLLFVCCGVFEITGFLLWLPFLVTLTKVSYFFSGNYNVVCIHLILLISELCVITYHKGIECLLNYCFVLDKLFSCKEELLFVYCQILGYLERCACNNMILLQHLNGIIQSNGSNMLLVVIFSFVIVYLFVCFLSLYVGLCRSFFASSDFSNEYFLYLYMFLALISSYCCL